MLDEAEQLAEFLFMRNDWLFRVLNVKWSDLSEKHRNHWRMDAKASIALINATRRDNEASHN